MTNKKLCTDCGTEYSEQLDRCPLCGSSQWEPAPESNGETQAEISELESRILRADETPKRAPEREARGTSQRKRSAKPRREVDDGMPKSLVIASTVLVFLAVLALGWHILAQWIPGLPTFGSSSQSENPSEKPSTSDHGDDQACWYLSCQQKSIAFNGEGQQIALNVKIEPENCKDPITYTSADPAVATVSEQGVVTAVGEGETSIRVSCGAMSQDVTVTCKFGEPILPELSQNTVEFTEIGKTQTVTVSNLADGQSVLWRSSNEAVATVDNSGTITAVGAGSCTITAQIDAQTLSVSVTVADADATLGTISTDGVRFRADPSTDGEVLGSFLEGDQVVILGKEDGWYHVEFGGTEGYVSADYVDVAE